MLLLWVAATRGTFLGNQGVFQFSSPLWLWITYEKIGATLWKSTSWTRKLTPVSPLSRHHTCGSEEWQFINFILPMIRVYDGIRDFYTMGKGTHRPCFCQWVVLPTVTREISTKILTIIFHVFPWFPDVSSSLNLGGGTSSLVPRTCYATPRGVRTGRGGSPVQWLDDFGHPFRNPDFFSHRLVFFWKTSWHFHMISAINRMQQKSLPYIYI